MSTQPKNLCKLRRGKALAAFPTFVDTFNWLVDFCSNLIGEGEDQTQSGTGASKLRVDRTVTDHPVIRGGGEQGRGKIVIVDNQDPPNMVEVDGVLYLESADDSNVKFEITKGEEGGRYVLKSGVYYA